MTTERNVIEPLIGVFPTEGGIMRKRILAMAGLAALAVASASHGARADTYNLIANPPLVLDAPGGTLTDFRYSIANLFTTAVESTASLNITLDSSTVFWGVIVKLTGGATAANFGGAGGANNYTETAILQPGTYGYQLDAYVANNGVPLSGTSPVSSASLSVTAVPGPVTGAGPAGLIMCLVLGGIAFARVRFGGPAGNI